MTLYQSPVAFDEASHTYTFNGKELSGVTSMLRRQLPDQYPNIPAFVLKKAADFGSKIHEEIQIADESGLFTNPLVAKYYSLRTCAGLEIIQNEYLVSDEEHIASMIDQVMTDGDGIILGDAKTTSRERDNDDLPHRESVTYQLNVYRVLFEKYNPTLKVKRLVAFWLDKHDPENSKIYDVSIIPDETIWAMIENDKNGKVFDYKPMVKSQDSMPVELIEIESAVIDVATKLKALKEAESALKAKFMQAMVAHDVTKWESPSGMLTITRVMASTKKTFDTKKFKEDNPKLYEKYVKESQVSQSIKFNIKNSNSNE